MSIEAVLKQIKDEDVAYVDIRFTDTRGKVQHVTVDCDLVDEDFLEEGFMFDGSSIAGWKSIENSDMKLMPDTDIHIPRPVLCRENSVHPLLIVEPDTGEAYERDPRGTAQKAEAYLEWPPVLATSPTWAQRLNSSSLTTFVSPTTINKVSYEVDATDASWNTDTEYEMGNMGHRPGLKGGYFPVNPIDEAQDLACGNALHDEAPRYEGRQASPRSCLLPARAWPDL